MFSGSADHLIITLRISNTRVMKWYILQYKKQLYCYVIICTLYETGLISFQIEHVLMHK